MREREMRQRVERFFQTRLRSMVMPATLGLGLALAGCDSDALDLSDDGGETAKKDAGSADQQLPPDSKLADASGYGADIGGAVMMYMAQMADAGTVLPDSGTVLRYMAQQPKDAGEDLGRFPTLYMAQLPVPRP
jgi:hypothetical protein